jgi:hypothetical protein
MENFVAHRTTPSDRIFTPATIDTPRYMLDFSF